MLGEYTTARYVSRVTVLANAARGLAFLHSRRLCHGALSAATVLVEDRRSVVRVPSSVS